MLSPILGTTHLYLLRYARAADSCFCASMRCRRSHYTGTWATGLPDYCNSETAVHWSLDCWDHFSSTMLEKLHWFKHEFSSEFSRGTATNPAVDASQTEALKLRDWSLRDWTMTGGIRPLHVDQRWSVINRSLLTSDISTSNEFINNLLACKY